LAQSLDANVVSSSANPPQEFSSSSSNSERKSLFRIAKNLNSKFLSTLGRVFITTSDGTLPSVVNNPSTATTSVNNTPPSTNVLEGTNGTSGFGGNGTSIPGGDATVGTSSSRSAGLGGEAGGNDTNSNSSIDKVSEKLAHKIAQLLANRRDHGGRWTRSYDESLDILDDQTAFDSEDIRWKEMFELGVTNTDKSNNVQYDAIKQKLKKWDKELCLSYFVISIKKLMLGENYQLKKLKVLRWNK